MEVKNKRSVILLGHAQSGKTSLSEAMLFKCNATTRKGTILEGNTLSDYNWDEIERKSSINAGFMFCDYQGIRIQVVDTPGFLDFYADVLSSIRAVDNAVVVIDGTAGVEVGTEKIWQLLDEANIPRIIFVNKTDKGVDKEKIVAEIREVLSKYAEVVDMNNVDTLEESVAESDDVLLEKYLSGQKLTHEEIVTGLHKAVDNAKVYPVVFGSALTDAGVEDLLKGIKDYLANPEEVPHLNLTTGSVTANDSSPFSAFIFKSIFDPYVGQLSLARVFSGKLAINNNFYNVNQKTTEKVGHLYFLQGKEQRPVEMVSCGDIIAIPKLKQAFTNDSLVCDAAHSVVFTPISFPETMMSASVKPKTRQDEEKISQSLAKLVAEDPTFKEKIDPETNEMIISGLGDLHLHVMIGRLKKRFNVDVELGKPKVPYKETVTKTVKVQGKFKRQSGGRGQYGDVWIEIHPLTHGKGFEFVDKVVGGAIPRNYIPSVEKGVRNALTQGVIAGFPVVDLQVVLCDGSYHDVDSSDMAFQRAGAMALRKAAKEAGPVLLEPIMEVDIYIPEEFMGAISGDLNSRRGRTLGMEAKGRSEVIKASVPLSEMFTYANDLRSMTQGKGSYTMKFSYYEQVPSKIANGIISNYQVVHNADED